MTTNTQIHDHALSLLEFYVLNYKILFNTLIYELHTTWGLFFVLIKKNNNKKDEIKKIISKKITIIILINKVINLDPVFKLLFKG